VRQAPKICHFTITKCCCNYLIIKRLTSIFLKNFFLLAALCGLYLKLSNNCPRQIKKTYRGTTPKKVTRPSPLSTGPGSWRPVKHILVNLLNFRKTSLLLGSVNKTISLLETLHCLSACSTAKRKKKQLNSTLKKVLIHI
jgi:hypothetical protein